MESDTNKLCDAEIAIEIGPADRSLIIQAPDASVIRIQQPSLGIESDAVVIIVGSVAVGSHPDRGPCHSAVQAADDAIRTGLPDGVNGVGAQRVYGQRGIVITLYPEVVGRIDKLVPGDAA